MNRHSNCPLLATAVLLATIASSCNKTYKPKEPVPPNTYLKAYIKDLSSPTLIQDYNKLPQASTDDKTAKVARRNQILREYIWIVDHNYGVFEAQYYGSEAGISTGGDIINLGLTGVASVTGTAHLKSVLSAIATGTTGIRTSYEKNFFDQQTRTAVVQKMRALRAEQLAALEDEHHLKAGVSDYSLEAGLNDVYAYYNAGTVIAALQSIAEQAGSQQQKATDQQQKNSKTEQKVQ